MACDDRQLSQAQRAAAFAQQRTGVVRAVRPFSGSATVENLVDYINRELGPAVRASRDAINECFLQVADNAPSANPLAFYFSESTAAADPTVGRIRLNASPQNTATVMRVSQSNARLVDVQPWLDVMAGGPTTPLGVVTLVDAINPARFIRWDLNTMTDQGAYWDLGITVIESSNDDPFVEDEAVVVGFISGVSAAGSTIPVGALTPIAADTFVGNITTGVAAPVAVPLASVDSTSVIYDATTHTFQRAALTGFAAATQNSNATTSAEPIVTYSASANMSAERVTTSSTSVTVSTSVANQIEFQRAAITGAIAVAANANASLFAGIRDNGLAEIDRTNLNFLSTTSIVSVVTDDSGSDELEVTHERAALTGDVTATQNSNATTIANDAVTNAKLANMATARLKGRTTTGTGDPEDLVLGNNGSVSFDVSAAGVIGLNRAAITGVVTAAQDTNVTAFGGFTNVPINEMALSGPSVSAGNATFWTRSTTPCAPMFKDDASANWELMAKPAGSHLASVQTLNNSTSRNEACSSVPGANSWTVGTTYKFEGYLVVTRGATATASTLTLDLQLGGLTYASCSASIFLNTSTSRTAIVTGYLRCISIGGAATFIGNITSVGNVQDLSATFDAGTVATMFSSSSNVGAAGGTVDTTTALTMSVGATMSVGVSSLSTNWTHAAFHRLAGVN